MTFAYLWVLSRDSKSIKKLLSVIHYLFAHSVSKRGLINSGPDALESFKDCRVSQTSVEVMLIRLRRS